MNIHDAILIQASKELSRRLEHNQAYSLRAYAKDIGISNTSLSQVLSQKRSLSQKMGICLIDSFKISGKDKKLLLSKFLAYFEGKKLSSHKHFIDRAGSFVSLEESEQYIVSNWWAYAIMSLGKSKKFDGTAEFLSGNLNLSLETVYECLQHLKNKNICVEKYKNFFVFTKQDFTSTHDIPNTFLRKQHKDLLDMGKEKIESLAVEERDFTFICMNSDERDLPRMKEWIKRFRRDFMKEFENNDSSKVFRLCIQLFPIGGPKND